MSTRLLTTLLLFAFLLVGCERQEAFLTEAEGPGQEASDLSLRFESSASMAKTGSIVSPALAALNESLAAGGLNIAVHAAEWMAPGTADAASGKIVFANDRTKSLGAQWVAGDVRGAVPDGDNLTYTVFSPLAVANGTIPAESILDAGYGEWQAQTGCSTLAITKRPTTVLPSAIFAGGDPFVADISEIGFLPGSFFDAVLGPGASTSVLGVTFTFIWLDGVGGSPTDINGDGYADVALKEIWYNDDFAWSTDGVGGFDILTVAAHEQGHALGFGHFGKLTYFPKKDRIQASPRALMNASYLGVYRQIDGTDNASYCKIYASWPN